MNRPQKCAVVGAGGIACCLLPILARIMDVVIIDADNYEPENYKRQFPALNHTGNKAEVLMEMIQENTLHSISAIPEYLEGLSILNNPLLEGADLLIGAVDNNESRHLIMEIALTLGIPAFLGGNEHEHGEAHAFYPGLYDPVLHHDFSGGDPAPFHCSSDKNLEEHPQTIFGNALAAGAIIHLLSSYERVENLSNAIVYSRMDPLSSRFARAKDYPAKA